MTKTKKSKKGIINELKERKEEMNPDEYNGCYKLIKKSVELLNQSDSNKLDYKDLDMLLFLGVIKLTISKRKDYINKSNLSNSNKKELKNLLYKIQEKTEANEYSMNKIGLVGTGYYTTNKDGNPPTNNEVIRIIKLCSKLLNENNGKKWINLIEKKLSEKISEVGTPVLSPVLHYIKPYYFPILNSKGIELYKELGVNLKSPKKLETYAENVRHIKQFRDDNFSFQNYRIIDEYFNKLKDSYDDEIYHCISIGNNNIYKISHGVEEIPSDAYKEFLENKVIVLHKNTKPLGRDSTSQADYFREANIGDYFYLCRSNKEIVLLGRIISEYEECKSNNMKSEGWIQRNYEIVKKAKSNTGYEGNAKSWTPNYNSTFKKIKPEEIELCNEKLFRPYFDITILTKESSKQKINITSTNNKSKKQYNKILSIPELNTSPSEYIDRLYFEDQNLINQIHTALKTGKHIILNGPPGTGKSKLAKEICKYYCSNDSKSYKMATATSDWSTFDTIGGLMPNNKDGNKLEFTKRIFLECFQDEDDNPANKWLILDEINRADIDKAFGALFSALTGDRVTLPQKRNGHEIEIIGDVENDEYNDKIKEENIKDNPHKFIIHPDWRIIATMNTFDKSSLYEMSYAFMRRFAFINIGVPDNLDEAIKNLFENIWKDDFSKLNIKHMSKLWETINEVRPIGPAIIEDIAKYVVENNNQKDSYSFADAIAMYVLPQFEGLEKDKLEKFTDNIYGLLDDNKEENKKQLKKIIKDFFQIELESEDKENG